jgi:hypothetical protein
LSWEAVRILGLEGRVIDRSFDGGGVAVMTCRQINLALASIPRQPANVPRIDLPVPITQRRPLSAAQVGYAKGVT